MSTPNLPRHLEGYDEGALVRVNEHAQFGWQTGLLGRIKWPKEGFYLELLQKAKRGERDWGTVVVKVNYSSFPSASKLKKAGMARAPLFSLLYLERLTLVQESLQMELF